MLLPLPPLLPQLTARYYMEFTGMDQDAVEMNTNRDYFMTPEDAVLEVRGAFSMGGWGCVWKRACARVRRCTLRLRRPPLAAGPH